MRAKPRVPAVPNERFWAVVGGDLQAGRIHRALAREGFASRHFAFWQDEGHGSAHPGRLVAASGRNFLGFLLECLGAHSVIGVVIIPPDLRASLPGRDPRLVLLVRLVRVAIRIGIPLAVEFRQRHPWLEDRRVKNLWSLGAISSTPFDYCGFGHRWRRPAVLFTAGIHPLDLQSLAARQCCHIDSNGGRRGHRHADTSGRTCEGVRWGNISKRRPPGLSLVLARLLCCPERCLRCGA